MPNTAEELTFAGLNSPYLYMPSTIVSNSNCSVCPTP